MKKAVTLKDIALKVGISINSVSKALRDSPSISKKTKEEVNKVVDELGYIPNVHAKSLKSGTIKVVGLIIDNLSNPYYTMMIDEVHSQLLEKGYEIMIFIDHHHTGYLSNVIAKKISYYRLCSVISFLSPTFEAANILALNNIKSIVIGRDASASETPSIYSNDYDGGALAAETLFNLGGRSFAYITKHAELKIDSLRHDGFYQKLIELGQEASNIESIVGNHEIQAEVILERVLNKKKIDSIFCFNDLIAFEIIDKLNQLGYKVPEDINVIGYDNIQQSIAYPLKVSSIGVDKSKIVSRAIRFLEDNDKRTLNRSCSVHFYSGHTTIDRTK